MKNSTTAELVSPLFIILINSQHTHTAAEVLVRMGGTILITTVWVVTMWVWSFVIMGLMGQIECHFILSIKQSELNRTCTYKIS